MSDLFKDEVPEEPGYYHIELQSNGTRAVGRREECNTWIIGESVWSDHEVVGVFRFGPRVLSAEEAARYADLVEIAKKSLVSAMSNYSEAMYFAGWLTGLDRLLWKKCQELAGSLDVGDETDCIDHISRLSTLTNGWAIWDEELGDGKWIPMVEWLAILEEGVLT